MTTLFVLSGPSGAGKSVLINRLLAEVPRLRFSVSCTTRQPRPGEQEGVSYHYITREQFETDIAAGFFLEHAEYSGNRYGTHFQEIERAAECGQDLLLDIEVQGARQLQEKNIEAVYIFVLPPSFAELENRLRSRKTETEQVVQQRLRQAVKDVPQIELYQYVVVNDDVEIAFQTLQSIVIAERARRHRVGSVLQPILKTFGTE